MASYSRVPWGPTMSKWEAERAERNRRSIARLTKSLPGVFPSAVLSRALGRPFAPPTPRLAIDSYWGAHPLRADRLARALAARSGVPTGWRWRLGGRFRTPPAPYRERAHAKGPFIASAGMPTFGTPVPTRMRPGTAPVRLHGNSGLRQVITSGS